MGVKNINVAVGGHQSGDYPKVYNTVYIKPNIPFALQVTEPNTKYVIRHKIDLGGKGDAVSDVDFTNAGTHEIAGVEYYYVPFTANGKPYTLLDDSCVFITSDWTGLSERTITPDEGTVFMIASMTGGLHTGAYINAEVVTMPENCILEFDGGSLDNGVIVGQDTVFINVGDVKIWGDNLVRLGTWREYSGGGSGSAKLNNYSRFFEESNLIRSPFFDKASDWVIDNCSIINSAVNIDGKGCVSQDYAFEATKLYMAVCYAKIDELTGITQREASGGYNSYGFYGRAGIGFRIRSKETYRGAYILNIDNVSNEQCGDYVPIIYIFRNSVNSNASISLGQLYCTNEVNAGRPKGSAKGTIIHAGLYDITGFYTNISYEKLYFEYKNWIEDKTNTYSASKEVVYPDSIAKEAFMERMNAAATIYGLQHSLFSNPSGVEGVFDSFNERETYETILSPVEVLENKYIDNTGAVRQNNGTNVYFYDVITSNIYIASNVLVRSANYTPLVTFWKGSTYSAYDFTYYQRVPTYFGSPQRTDFTEETLIKVPIGVTRIAIMSVTDHVPVFKCYSQAAINESSALVTERLGHHLKENISNCVDTAVLAGIAASQERTQNLFCAENKVISWIDNGGKNQQCLYRQYSSADDWYIVTSKGGSTNVDGQTNYQYRYSICAKNRENGKFYTVCIARQAPLPDYTDNPDREAANNSTNLMFRLLNFAKNKVKVTISEFTPVNGTIISNSQNPNYNKWIIGNPEDKFQSSLIDVTEYRGYDVCIYKNADFGGGRYTFLTSEPVVDELVSYAEGFSSFVPYTTSTVSTRVPNNAKYLVVHYKEIDVYLYPKQVKLQSHLDLEDCDYDAVCVGEVQNDVPCAFNDYDRQGSNYASALTKFYREFDGKNMNMCFQPYSTTKILTALVALDYLKESDNIEVALTDRCNGSGLNYMDGETVTVADAIQMLIYYSDNSLAHALARKAGYEILKRRRLLLLDKTVIRQQ